MCTDGNFTYGAVLPSKIKHFSTKSETCLVESFNSLLRHYIPCLARKTKAFAKSRQGLNRAMRFYMFRDIICR